METSQATARGEIGNVSALPRRRRAQSCPYIKPQGIPLGTTAAQLASKSFWNMEMLQETLRQIAHDQAKNPIPAIIEELKLPEGDMVACNCSMSEVLPVEKIVDSSSHDEESRKTFDKNDFLYHQRMWSINSTGRVQNSNGCLHSKSF